jgi:hypothetical protein
MWTLVRIDGHPEGNIQTSASHHRIASAKRYGRVSSLAVRNSECKMLASNHTRLANNRQTPGSPQWRRIANTKRFTAPTRSKQTFVSLIKANP